MALSGGGLADDAGNDKALVAFADGVSSIGIAGALLLLAIAKGPFQSVPRRGADADSSGMSTCVFGESGPRATP